MSADSQVAVATTEPRVLDTYALFYSFALVSFIPAMALLAQLPFRTYTFSYVSLATVPFLIGIVATFFTDSEDGLRRVLIRTAILTPIIVFTGVGVLTTSSLLVLPMSYFLSPDNFGWIMWAAMGVVALLAAPLPVALFRRVTSRPIKWATVIQVVFIVAALLVVAAALVATARGDLTRELARKDITIYIIGAVTWYLPSFGITTGAWRRLGLV
jgi:hypothetical protein